MQVDGLREADARALLDSVLTAPLDERVRDQFVAETGGNPLALLELPRGLGVHELAGGFGLPGAAPLSAAVEESFRREVQALPEQTRRLLLLAAAEPLGDPALLWRAAARLGIGADAARTGSRSGPGGVRCPGAVSSSAGAFGGLPVGVCPGKTVGAPSTGRRRPIRTATPIGVRGTAPRRPRDRTRTSPPSLERSAGRARARGGLAAAAAFLERATMLTIDPGLRAERALAAASANLDAGAFAAAADLLAVAEGGPLSDLQHARTDLIRARLAFVTGRGNDAPPLLLKAARRLQPVDTALSRATYLDAMEAAFFAGRLASGAGLLDVARAARTAPQPHSPRLSDLVLDGFVAHFIDGYAAGLPILRRAVSAARDGSTPDDEPQFMVAVAATHIWDDEGLDVITARHVELARAAGAMTQLPLALSARARNLLYTGDLAAAEAVIHEAQTVTRATGDRFATSAVMALFGFRGDQAELSALIEANTSDVMKRGEGSWLTVAEYAGALLNNGIGNHTAALTLAQRAAEQPDLATPARAAVELVEAAARCGAAADRDRSPHQACGNRPLPRAPIGRSASRRVRAHCLPKAPEAERLYRQAIELSGRTRMRTELARAHLALWGMAAPGAPPHRRAGTAAHRARHVRRDGHARRSPSGPGANLLATGETARKRTAAPSGPQLTPQEAHVARLAAEGLTNPDIGARLFISAKTVQYHLSKVFTKLGISSRSQLHQALPSGRHLHDGHGAVR